MKTINSFRSKLLALTLALMASVSTFAYKSQWCDTWNMLVRTGSVYPPSSTPYRYQLAKDTVIGDYTYTAVVSKAINDALDAPHYVAAVRFTDDRKVYIYYDNAEYLLYDFNVQQGDELEVFAGINNYRFGIKTYKCIVTGVEQYACIGCPATITLHVPNHPDDFTEIYRRTQWQEGVGDVYSGFLNGVNGYVPVDGGGSVHLLCAYQGDELKYTGDLYEEYGCGDDAEQTPEDLFPTLWGLQRTEVEFHTDGASSSSLVSFNEYTPTLVNGKWYLYDGRNYLREENNQVLLYSPEFEIYEDVVLYDWTLEIGDTLPFTIRPFDDDKSRGAVFRVTDVSTITLLDGKEYKKWTLACGIEYIEGIGAINGEGFGNYFCIQHTAHPATYIDTRLVCASRNGQLLYKMDDTEMERLGAECLCEVETSYKSQWCDTWNVMLFDGMRFDETASTSQYRLGKDTIIGDYVYSKFTSRTSVRFTSDRKVYVYYEGFDDNDPYTEDLPTGEYLAYDFSAQVGDTLEVFSGVGTYSTYSCIVYDVQTDSETNLRNIMLHPLCVVDEDGNVEVSGEEITWLEGVGSPEGFLISYLPCGWAGGGTFALLCAYKGDDLKYTGSLYDEYGCEYNAGVVSEDHFPMLAGLSRTICKEYYSSDVENNSQNNTYLQEFTTPILGLGHLYLYYENMLIREEDDKILIVSRTLDNLEPKEFVLYDFTLQVGDSLTMLYIDYYDNGSWIPNYELLNVVDYRRDEDGTKHPADILIVTDVSMITLSDGKEYKKWTFNNGMEYVEGIGSFGNDQWSGDFFQLIANKGVPTSLLGEHLVCASKNGQLLYQMNAAEMERLGAECLCDYIPTIKDNAKNGKIGGRPTPTQWYVLDIETKDMGDPRPTVLRAETFSYTLENDSIVVNGRTFYQLACQSTKDTATTKSVVGALHFSEDKGNHVYFLRDGVEYLLYDFTAEPGDTIEIFAGINNYPQETTYTHVVADKDTTEDGACRMFLEVVFPKETTTVENAEKVWLAGLGSIDGIVHNTAKRASIARSSETQTSIMLCAWREDDCLYTTNHPDYQTLGCVYNIDETTAVDDIHTSPSYQKLLRDGRLLIIHEGKTYNVMGVAIE